MGQGKADSEGRVTIDEATRAMKSRFDLEVEGKVYSVAEFNVTPENWSCISHDLFLIGNAMGIVGRYLQIRGVVAHSFGVSRSRIDVCAEPRLMKGALVKCDSVDHAIKGAREELRRYASAPRDYQVETDPILNRKGTMSTMDVPKRRP